MQRSQKSVLEFHRTFDLPHPTAPTQQTIEVRKLRAKLLLEEVLEYVTAAGLKAKVEIAPEGSYFTEFEPTGEAPDLVGMADALGDIQYVNDGAAVAHGLDLEPFSVEIHRSNMSKAWQPEEVHLVPSDHSTFVQPNGKVIVKRPDGKVVKSPSYSKADLASVMHDQICLHSTPIPVSAPVAADHTTQSPPGVSV